tara:strand:- start:2951 stop:3571 length:621 start_codon:yes stop_codon:yes gene_type:complete
MKISMYSSGSTGKQKKVTHHMGDFYKAGNWLVEKWGIDNRDVILNPFPTWTIASWAFCIIPAKITHCEIVNIKMEPLKFWDVVEEVKPTVLTLAVGTWRILVKRRKPNLEFVKNFSTGSAPVTDEDISLMKATGAEKIWNIYGSTECIPPVMMSNNSIFNFQESPYYLEHEDTLFVDGVNTGDTFDLDTGEFLTRSTQIKNDTWKS